MVLHASLSLLIYEPRLFFLPTIVQPEAQWIAKVPYQFVLAHFPRNSSIEMVWTFGKGISFSTWKCLSCVTIYSAWAAIAQSTYLLSSVSASISFQLK